MFHHVHQQLARKRPEDMLFLKLKKKKEKEKICFFLPWQSQFSVPLSASKILSCALDRHNTTKTNPQSFTVQFATHSSENRSINILSPSVMHSIDECWQQVQKGGKCQVDPILVSWVISNLDIK